MTRIETDIGGTFTDIVWVDDRTGLVLAEVLVGLMTVEAAGSEYGVILDP